jgi:hypothetical protein
MIVFGTTSLRIIIKRTSAKKAYKTLHGELNLLQLSVNDIRAEIKTIRTRCCSELAKMRKSEKSGDGSNDLYVPRLFWFKQSPTFWKLVKRIEPLKGINTPAFIFHIHWGWIHLRCISEVQKCKFALTNKRQLRNELHSPIFCHVFLIT